MRRYFSSRMELRSVGQGQQPLVFSLPSCDLGIPSITGLSRWCWECQQTHSIILYGWITQVKRWSAIPEEEPQKCLNLSSFLYLLMNDLRVLDFLDRLLSSLLWVGKGLCLTELNFQSTWLLHCNILKWQFHDWECKVGPHLDPFYYVFYKALHMRGGCRDICKTS